MQLMINLADRPRTAHQAWHTQTLPYPQRTLAPVPSSPQKPDQWPTSPFQRSDFSTNSIILNAPNHPFSIPELIPRYQSPTKIHFPRIFLIFFRSRSHPVGEIFLPRSFLDIYIFLLRLFACPSPSDGPDVADNCNQCGNLQFAFFVVVDPCEIGQFLALCCRFCGGGS